MLYLPEMEINQNNLKIFQGPRPQWSELNGAVFTPLKRMTKGDRYYLRVKAKLEEVHLPLNLEYVLFFVSLWDFETDWLKAGLCLLMRLSFHKSHDAMKTVSRINPVSEANRYT